MTDLIGLHLFEDRSAARIVRGQPVEMIRKMSLDLFFGLRHESETHAIAAETRDGTDGNRTRVPERIQQGRARTQLFQTVAAPGQVIAFFVGRVAECNTRLGGPGREGLALIEALGRDFPGVIDSHQPGDVAAAAGIGKCRRRLSRRRTGTWRPREAAPKARIGQFQQAIEGGKYAWLHVTHII